MNVLALAAREFQIGTAFAAGVWPTPFPLRREGAFDVRLLEGRDLIYVCLHGLRDQPYLYADRFETAIGADQIRTARIDGAVVYMAGCFGDGPVADAFLEAGASAIVGDSDTTWAGTWLPLGSNRLGRLFVRGMRGGRDADSAYRFARERFAATSTDPRDDAILNTVTIRYGLHRAGV